MNKSEDQFDDSQKPQGIPSIREIWGVTTGIPPLKEMLDSDK